MEVGWRDDAVISAEAEAEADGAGTADAKAGARPIARRGGRRSRAAAPRAVTRRLDGTLAVRAQSLRLAADCPPPEALVLSEESGCLVVDRRWRIRYASPLFTRIEAAPVQHIAGRDYWQVFPEAAGTEVETAIRAVMGGEPMRRVTVPHAPTGKIHDVRFHPTAIGVTIYFNDATAYRRAERSLVEVESKFRATFEQAALGLALVAIDGSWLRVNDRLCAIVGRSRDELMSMTFQQITHPDDLERDLDHVAALLAGKIATYSLEKRYLLPDGSPVWANLTVSLVREDGTPSYFISAVEEIEDRKAITAELERRAALIDQAYDAIFAWDWNGAIRSWNRGAERLYGFSAEEAIGRTSHELLRTHHPDGIAAFLANLERDGIAERELEHTRRDGRRVVVESRQQVVRDGPQMLVLEANRDVTARRADEPRRQLLSDVQSDISAIVDPDEQIWAVTQRLGSFFAANRVTLIEIDEAAGEARTHRDYRADGMPTVSGVGPIGTSFGEPTLGLLRAGQTIAIEDIRSDWRTRDRVAYFTGNGIEAALLVPVLRDGVWVAVFIVISAEARAWDAGDIAALETVADRVWLAVERSRLLSETVAALVAQRASETRLRIALNAARMSTWEWEPEGNGLTSETGLVEIYGEPMTSLEAALQRVDPADREIVQDAIEHAIVSDDPYSLEYRILSHDGSTRWIAGAGQRVSEDGRPDRLIGVAQDVTERKRIEAALREREARLRTLTEAMPQMVFVNNREGACEYVNGRWVAYSGKTESESLGYGWIDAVHPEDVAGVLQAWRDVLLSGSEFEAEYRIRGADGRYSWFLGRAVPLDASDGTPTSWLGTCTDIDDMRNVDEARARSERLLRSLVVATAQVIWTADPIGAPESDETIPGIEEHSWAKFTGLSDQGVGPGWIAAIHADDRHRISAQWRASIRAGAPFELEYRVRHRDGTWRTMIDRGVPVQGPDAEVERWIGTGTDVTSRRDAEEAVRRSEARFRRLSDANIFGVAFWRADGLITEANDAFLTMVGRSRHDLEAGKVHARAMTPVEWLEVDARARDELASSGACAPYEKELLRPDGSRVAILITAAMLTDEAGGIAAVLDLTEQRARERFEQEFLADIAHDLRNPLAASKAQAQLMRRRLRTNKLDMESLDDALTSIESNATRMSKRIEELTDNARLRAGHALDLQLELVDLVALTERVVENYRLTTDRHTIELHADPSALSGQWDTTRIERVIDNLLSNAVKYSAGGPIQVDIRRSKVNGADVALLTVRDQGVGIPRKDVPFVFDRFRRGSNVRGRVGGTGIGLAGVRNVIEQHGGTIGVESVEGAGSTFTVCLPLAPGSKQ